MVGWGGFACGRGELGETVRDEEDEVNEETVGRACRNISKLSLAMHDQRLTLDLKVSEKTVCSEPADTGQS